MIKYQIPPVFIEGFKTLSQLPREEVNRIGDVLNELHPGSNAEKFENELKKAGISVKGVTTSKALFSLGQLLLKSAEPLEDLVRNITDSIVDKNGEMDGELLENNLLIILKNAGNLKKTFKIYQLLSENAHTYRSAKIVTDIRLVFGDNLENAADSGVIIHQLKLEYLKDNHKQSFFISLDSGDVQRLLETLNRAIEKENCIKRDNENIHFINIES